MAGSSRNCLDRFELQGPLVNGLKGEMPDSVRIVHRAKLTIGENHVYAPALPASAKQPTGQVVCFFLNKLSKARLTPVHLGTEPFRSH